MTDLAGKAAIVTGASRNLGRGFAEMLGKRGASVLVHYHTDESRPDAETTASLVRRAGGKAEPIQADFTDANAVESLPKHCLSHFGRFDILINGAAQIIKKSFQEISGQEFDRLFAINTKAPFLLMRAAAMHMGSGGRIVNIGTSVLACSFPFYSIYAGSKAPLEQFTRALAKEVGSRGITVNTIAWEHWIRLSSTARKRKSRLPRSNNSPEVWAKLMTLCQRSSFWSALARIG